jgi:mannitol/fructose-specific phosphotransferase system IIA component (Ntr-type)
MQENDPVTVVLAFGAVDATRHVDLLAALARFLGDEHCFERVKAAHTTSEVLQAVQDYENTISQGEEI